MNMAEDQVDETVQGESFGEVTEREPGDSQVVQDPQDPQDNTTTDDSDEETKVVEETEEVKETEEGEETDKEELTDKGTKLDKNPVSRAHQELANERKLRGQMEQVLKSPELMARFMKDQYGIEVPLKGAETKTETATEAVTPEFKEYKAEDFENLEDVASKFNDLQKGFIEKGKTQEAQIEKLTSVVASLVDGGRRTQVASNIKSGVDTLRSEKELNPKDPEFIQGLEEKIAERFNQLDFDEKTGTYRGQHSIEEVGKEFLEAIRMGRKAGSQKAQTIVQDKTQGKVVTSSKVEDESDGSELSPADSIAAGVRKMFKH